MNKSNKFVIYSPGRTGSTLYERIINFYLLKDRWASISEDDEWRQNTSYSSYDGTPDWSKPIQHTHQYNVFKNAPADYIRILATRSILDSATSGFVAQATNQWHVISDQDVVDYNKNLNKKYHIDIEEFIYSVKNYDFDYSIAYSWYKSYQGEKYRLEYNIHGINIQAAYDYLKMDIIANDTILQYLIKKIPIDKFLLVENLQELLDTYKSLNVQNKFDDEITINHVENILKGQQ